MTFWKPWAKKKSSADWLGKVECSVLTDIGCYREVNQDSGTYFLPADPAVAAEKGLMVIVADGVGGHSGGEVASSLAVKVILQDYYRRNSNPNDALQAACAEANRVIYKRSQEEESLRGMGTTCVALVMRDAECWCASVGDSRLYLVREGSIYLMTQDDSVVMDMVKQGLLSLEEARHHPDKNVILRALGTHAETVVTIWKEPFPVRLGDRFVLCTDGLYDLVEDREIGTLISRAQPQAACAELINLAKTRGGHDNITAGILAFGAQEAAAEEPLPETRTGEALQ